MNLAAMAPHFSIEGVAVVVNRIVLSKGFVMANKTPKRARIKILTVGAKNQADNVEITASTSETLLIESRLPLVPTNGVH